MEYSDKQIGRNIKAIRNANKKSYLDFAATIGDNTTTSQKKRKVQRILKCY